jgi:TRAP-type C4-dicarboxylate transport system substrate-binding protein
MLAAGAAAVIGASSAPARAATELTLVYPFPDFLIYTKLCKELVNKINTRGKGLVSVKILPYNSIGMFKQPTAVRSGRVDLVCTPAAFYARAIPENEAIATSNSSPKRVRANGGMKMVDDAHQKYFNMKYLGWTSSGGRFRIYMKSAPKFTAKGLPDFTGVKLRDNPIYGAFFRALNATTHPMKSSQVYSALEKGVVNASAWATIGLKGLKWDKFLRHAIEPEFYQTDIGWTMNLGKWKSLSPAARKFLQTTVIAHENAARARLEQLAKEERATLIKEGMMFHKAPNPSAYLKLAVDSAYARMEGRVKKAKRSTAHLGRLRSAWQE